MPELFVLSTRCYFQELARSNGGPIDHSCHFVSSRDFSVTVIRGRQQATSLVEMKGGIVSNKRAVGKARAVFGCLYGISSFAFAADAVTLRMNVLLTCTRNRNSFE